MLFYLGQNELVFSETASRFIISPHLSEFLASGSPTDDVKLIDSAINASSVEVNQSRKTLIELFLYEIRGHS